jgi:hypothetical protein
VGGVLGLPDIIMPAPTAGYDSEEELREERRAEREAAEDADGRPATVLLPVHVASGEGQFAELRRLIQENAAVVDSTDSEGRTPLMHAVHGHHSPCVDLLLKHGADVHLKALDGSTALHEAVSYLGSFGARGLGIAPGGSGIVIGLIR